MKITYTPADGDRQEYTVNLDRIRRKRAETLQLIFGRGKSWAEFYGALLAGDARAQAITLWHAMTVEHPELRWEDLPDYEMGEVQFTYLQSEYERVIQGIENSEDISPADKAKAVEFYRARIAALDLAEADEIAAAGESGKEQS